LAAPGARSSIARGGETHSQNRFHPTRTARVMRAPRRATPQMIDRDEALKVLLQNPLDSLPIAFMWGT
jgi:hypothetical protein